MSLLIVLCSFLSPSLFHIDAHVLLDLTAACSSALSCIFTMLLLMFFVFFSEYRSLLQIISLAKMCTFPSLCPVEYSLAHFLKLAGSEHLRVLFWLTVSFFKNWSQLVGMRQSVI